MTRTSTSVLAMVAAAAVLTAGAAGRGTTRDFGDAAGDAGGGPDIRRVTIADSGGTVTFTITVTGMKAAPAAGVAEAAFQASLDTNRDGKPDYRLVAGVNASGRYANVVDVAKRGARCRPRGRSTTFAAATPTRSWSARATSAAPRASTSA